MIPEISHLCPICSKPVDLARDRYTNEDGKLVHERCYLKRLLSPENDPRGPQHAE